MACNRISKRVITHTFITLSFITSLSLQADKTALGLEFVYDHKGLSVMLSGSYATKPSNYTLSGSLSYPNNIITTAIKHKPSDLAIAASYNYSKGQYSFASKGSSRTNPGIALSTHMLTDQINTICKPYKKNVRLAAYIQQLHETTIDIQKNEFHNLKEANQNTLHNLSENDPNRLEIEKIMKNLEAHYGQ